MAEEAMDTALEQRIPGVEGDYATSEPGSYPDFYPDIPGSIIELRDGVGTERESSYQGRRILLLGTAIDGPVLENIQIEDMDAGTHVFGDYYDKEAQIPNGATLTKGLKRALNAGADNIQLMRVSGQKATGEIPLAPDYEELIHDSTVQTMAEGNGETTIELDLDIAPGYDDVRLGNVYVTTTQGVLSTDEFDVDSDNHKITIYEDVALSSEEVTVEYEERQIVETENTETDLVQGATEGEFYLAEQDILEGSETITVELSDGDEMEIDSSEYDLTPESGQLTIYDPEYHNVVEASYKHVEERTSQEVKRASLVEKRQEIELNHIADSRRPVVVTGSRTGELSDDDFDVSWDTSEVSKVFIEPGALENGESVTVSYYWVEEKEVETGINVESVFGGSKYNDIKIVVEDDIVAVPDEQVEVVKEENIGDVSEGERITFNEADEVMEDSVFLTCDSGDLLGVNEDGDVIGAYQDEEDFDPQGDEDNPDYVLRANDGMIEFQGDYNDVTATYAHEIYEDKKYSTFRGVFNQGTCEDGELGGGYYNPLALSVQEGRKVVSFPTEHILADYFEKYPEKLTFQVVEEEEVNEYTYQEIKDGDSDALSEDDFEIDYREGEIVFDERALGHNEKVYCEDVKSYNISSKQITIHKPEDKYDMSDRPIRITGLGSKITNLAQLVDYFNGHPRNNIAYFSIDRDHKARSALELLTPEQKLTGWDEGDPVPQEIYLFGGRDEVDLTREELYEKLEEAYNVAKNIEDIDIVVPLGVYADTELLSQTNNFAQQLANFCAHTFLRNNEIQGVIGTEPLQNPSRSNVMDKVNDLLELDTDFYMRNTDGDLVYDSDGNQVDIGRFISIVGYDKSYEDEFLAVPSIESGATDFAAIASMLSPHNSPTNEKTRNGQLAFQISNYQAQGLIRNKIIPARVKQGTPKILDAMTCAQENSGWTRWFTVDIAFNTISNLRGIYDRYIGKANEYEQRSSLDSDIRTELDQDPTIIEYDYDLILDPSDPEMGKLIVELELVPAAELQRIKTVVSINRGLHPEA